MTCTCQSCPQCIGLSNYAASLMRKTIKPDPSKLNSTLLEYAKAIQERKHDIENVENYLKAADLLRNIKSTKHHYNAIMERAEGLVDEINAVLNPIEKKVIDAVKFNFNEN